MDSTQNEELMEILTPSILAGRYRFISLLGEGAQGKTWLAEKLSDGTKVAIKELKFSEIDNQKNYELFIREAEMLKNLEVQGVPVFYECVSDDSVSKTCWIVQEYVSFRSLQFELEKAGKLSETCVLRIMLSITDILKELQTKYTPPVIHRDIKPSNILCNMSNYQTWLIDFGAVANPHKKSGGSTIAGTFGYMAPEQLLGESRIQSDFYSLGVTALQLLTGVSPVDMPVSVFEIQFESIIRRHAPNTSEQTIMLLSHLLSVEAANRPASAESLRGEIECAIHGIMPVIKNEKAGFGKKVLQFLLRTLKKGWFSVHHQESDVGWIYAEGIIHRETISGLMEYTFDAKGRTWLGRCLYASAKKQFPIYCLVAYKPDNPRFNRIAYSDELQNLEK